MLSGPDAATLKSLKLKQTEAGPGEVSAGIPVTFGFKVNKKAATGTIMLTFTGTDSSGRVRTGVLMVTID
jgi:hypothetical protein